jgi:hypothetical protein
VGVDVKLSAAKPKTVEEVPAQVEQDTGVEGGGHLTCGDRPNVSVQSERRPQKLLFCRATDAWLIIKTAFAIALIISARAILASCSSAKPNVVIGSLCSLQILNCAKPPSAMFN